MVQEQIRGGLIETLILTPDRNGLVLRFAPSAAWRGISNVLRLTLDGAEEWRAEMTETVRPWGYHHIASDGKTLHASAHPLEAPLVLDWETGRVRG